MDAVKYLVFDVESIADGQLVSKLKYPDQSLSPRDAVDRYRSELMEKYQNDFIPYTFQVPVSVVVGKVDPSFRLLDVVALDEPDYRPHVITKDFWRGWEAYRRPTLVSFNGRGFDLPLMELAAFRYGVGLGKWFDTSARSYDQPRNRFNVGAHLDLYELLTNFGAARFNGGLNLAANLLGKPGKMEVEGHMVQDLANDGEIQRINDYCRCDVLDTYFVFLRSRVLAGELPLETEQGIVATTKRWLEERSSQVAPYGNYLEQWGDWPDPWEKTLPAASVHASGDRG